MQAALEYTDTFGREANYSWVKRGRIKAPENKRVLIRAAKRWAGLTGVKCDTTDFGDMIEIRPQGMCTVLFINYVEDDDGSA